MSWRDYKFNEDDAIEHNSRVAQAIKQAIGEYMSMEQLVDNIIQWGTDRGIITNGNPQTQCLKLGSEFGELCDNIAKGRYEAAKDDIGDMIVVLVMIATQIDTDLGECLEVAWNDIKDRKGYLNPEGVFVKEGDV